MSNIDAHPPNNKKHTTQKINQMSNIDRPPQKKNKKQKTHTRQKTNKMSNIDPNPHPKNGKHKKLTR
jgi:hypothetical protein